MEHLVMKKAGVLLGILASFPDGTKLTRVCDCAKCKKLPRGQRFKLLPCGCHGCIVECTCRVREKSCEECGRVFVASKSYEVRGQRFVDVYEIEDPHGDNAKL